MFYPKDIITNIWNTIISLVLLYVTFIMTFELAFIDEPSQFFLISEYLTTALFGFDIIFNFNRAFLNKKDELVTDRKVIAIKYIKSWFFLDFVSFFPFFIFSKINSKLGITISLKTLKILKVLNIVRLIRLIKIIKKMANYQFKDPISRLKRNIKKNYERLAIHCILILISCHLFACFFYFFPRLISPDNNWVVNRQLGNAHYLHKYLYSLHWIIETIITVGYGEVPIK
jgi:hypothetical protein